MEFVVYIVFILRGVGGLIIFYFFNWEIYFCSCDLIIFKSGVEGVSYSVGRFVAFEWIL